MAIVIHRLWQDNDQDPMIMPGSLPLHDMQVRVKSTQYLPQGWDVVITKEIDGIDSLSAEIDKEQRFGAVQAAHRASRTIFLGSAPSNAAQSARGLLKERVLLGCGRPGDELAVYEDVFKRLRDRLHYLFGGNGRFWFDTHPNLRREMEARKEKVYFALIQETLKKLMESRIGKSSFFSGLHVFTPIRDIPDELGNGVRLVLLEPETVNSFSKANPENTYKQVHAILGGGGVVRDPMPEVKSRVYKNRVVFLAPDSGVIERVIDQCKSYLAWCEIENEVENGRLVLDTLQLKSLKQEKDSAYTHLGNVLMECYKHLIVPTAENERMIRLEVRTISCRGTKIVDVVRDVLLDSEYVVQRYSPVLLKQVLDKYYFSKGKKEVSIDQLWKDMCMYYYFQRLQNVDVLRDTIAEGVASGDFFGYASGKEDGKYLGFALGKQVFIHADSASIIIEREAAKQYQAQQAAAAPIPPTPNPDDMPGGSSGCDNGSGGGTTTVVTPPQPGPGSEGNTPTPVQKMRRYCGSVELDSFNPEGTFHDVVEEIVSLFTKQIGVTVKIRVEIEAETKEQMSFDSATVRAVKENANAMKFQESVFSEYKCL